eukprot:CAMPEP_0178423476 /NCGR_PEP_ID=MMETSP0689_2-20121128/27708_1 /TAXON_ID=160604 /ORGANISM="Amphidinium massartii, Strain CS-259" /LENGTH=600 /DNA_ID=CAMNT_0020045071 /DNA_START=74 /DNA_END=1873 /DNA_ORIENTATION=+
MTGLLAPKKLNGTKAQAAAAVPPLSQSALQHALLMQKQKSGRSSKGGQKPRASRSVGAKRVPIEALTAGVALSRNASTADLSDPPLSPATTSTRATPMDSMSLLSAKPTPRQESLSARPTPRQRMGKLEGVAKPTNSSNPPLTAKMLSQHTAEAQRRARSTDAKRSKEALGMSRQASEKQIPVQRRVPKAPAEDVAEVSEFVEDVHESTTTTDHEDIVQLETSSPGTRQKARPAAIYTKNLVRHLAQAAVEEKVASPTGQAQAPQLLQSLLGGFAEDGSPRSPCSPQAMALAETALERSQKLLESLRTSGLGLVEEEDATEYGTEEDLESLEDFLFERASNQGQGPQTVEVPVELLKLLSSMWGELQQQRNSPQAAGAGDAARKESEDAAVETQTDMDQDKCCDLPSARMCGALSRSSTSCGATSVGGHSLSVASWCSTPQGACTPLSNSTHSTHMRSYLRRSCMPTARRASLTSVCPDHMMNNPPALSRTNTSPNGLFRSSMTQEGARLASSASVSQLPTPRGYAPPQFEAVQAPPSLSTSASLSQLATPRLVTRSPSQYVLPGAPLQAVQRSVTVAGGPPSRASLPAQTPRNTLTTTP